MASSFPALALTILANGNRDAQEGCGNGGDILARAAVLAVEQSLQFLLQVGGSSVLFRRLEGVHRWPIVFSKRRQERRRRRGIVERIGVSRERNLISGNSR